MCGGKLNGQGMCTECGLDNNKSDRNYRLNQSECDHMPLTHVHEHPVQPKLVNKPKKKGGCLRVIFIMLIFLIVCGGILIPFIMTIRDKVEEYAYQQSAQERSDPYDDIENALPESGSSETFELTSGAYVVGVHIPAGNYSVDSEYDYDTVSVDDSDNGIYLYEYAGKEDNCLNDIRLYNGALVNIESQTKMIFSTENAQTLIAGESNPQTAEVRIEGGRSYVAGNDFEAGVYDLEAVEGSGNLEIRIAGKSGTEITTRYMYLGEHASGGKGYKNLVIPNGSTIQCEEDISVRLVPSEKIVSDDYADYYEKY